MDNIHITEAVEKVIRTSIEQDMPLLLVGETGTGKTTIIKAFAEEQGKKLHRISVNGTTSIEEIIGKFIVLNKSMVWQDGLLIEAMKNGDWVVFDEINSALPEILFALHSLLDDDRKITLIENQNQVVHPHVDFRFFGAMNPPHEYAGTKELNKALESRLLRLNIAVLPNDKEISLLESKGISNENACKLVDLAQKLRDFKDKEDIYFFCSTRDIINAGKLIENGVEFDTSLRATILNKMQPEDESFLVKEGIISEEAIASLGEKFISDKEAIETLEKINSDITSENRHLDDKLTSLNNELVSLRNDLIIAKQTVNDTDKVSKLEDLLLQKSMECDALYLENKSLKTSVGEITN